jgi:hypothetical protein
MGWPERDIAQAAGFIAPPGYACHRPETTLLYRLVAEHYPKFRDRRVAEGRTLGYDRLCGGKPHPGPRAGSNPLAEQRLSKDTNLYAAGFAGRRQNAWRFLSWQSLPTARTSST